jgi:hypothetical protein
MLRIAVLENGTLELRGADGTAYTYDADTLPEPTKERYFMLRAADVMVRIEGVGTHVSTNTYWVVEDGDNGWLDPRMLAEIADKEMRNQISAKNHNPQTKR